MSALPPKADIDQHGRDVRFAPKADMDHLIRSHLRRSFEEHVSTSQECFWNDETYGLRTLQINGELKLRRLLYGKVIRPFALQDPVHEFGAKPKQGGAVCAV